jgi:chemotaxis protein MotB
VRRAKTKGNDDRKIVIKKVRSRHGGHASGAWKVAYADFVTSLMALFIVLWILAAGDQQLKAGVAQYFRDPGVFENSAGLIPIARQGEQAVLKTGGESLRGLQEGLEEDLRALQEYSSIQEQISLRLTSDGLLIELIDTDSQAFFDLSSAELKPVLRRVLAVIVERIKELPNTIAISGHTDARQYHNRAFYSNWELSTARAHNARRAMEDLSFPAARVERVVGYADRLPLSPDDPLDPANRRISILVLKELEPVKNAAATEEQNPVVAARASFH